MNRYKKAIMGFGLLLVPLMYAYRKEMIVLGEKPPFEATYYVNKVENGTWRRYAVHLTAAEKNALQRAVKKHYNSDSGFNKLITEGDIPLVLSGCHASERNFCTVIEDVLRDFIGRGKSFGDLFSEVGLSRDI